MESPTVVQHVTKASSDQLLRKFADSDSDNEIQTPSSARKRQGHKKRKDNINNWELCIVISPSKELNSNGSLRVLERKSLLPQHYKTRRSSRSFFVKHLAISTRSHHFRTNSLLSAIDKTWSKAVRGASKVFMEKHYNRHRCLIDDIVV
ncbi:hypothetical protein SOVF_010370 [Spinacia oleracea]|uniref:Uncharacterized protein n=1 Tax=Spinacia oleracea TaxID=3562 RepID=A0A9R0J6W4_SPIOL|nr:uncharacterized protein LOC110800122 [Spinacia oleracea]KNA24997.1 hypothetical protein SOVF_010370 [Spinacia oleracea]